MWIQQHFTQKVEYDAKADYFSVVESEIDCRKRRDAWAKEMKAKGYKVRRSSNGLQLMSYGGIGSGKAHCEHWVKSYTADAYN